jgi:hypothetical protein
MSNFVKSKNQLWKESGTTLSFKDWVQREAMKGTIPPKEHLLNVSGDDKSLDTTKFEESLGLNNPKKNEEIIDTNKFEKILGLSDNQDDTYTKNKNQFLGLNKWLLISCGLIIAGTLVYKVYTKKK